nr:MAG TPA: hypothetical protein [Caudoviricetes sp.]
MFLTSVVKRRSKLGQRFQGVIILVTACIFKGCEMRLLKTYTG